jgi:hypothetical protein
MPAKAATFEARIKAVQAQHLLETMSMIAVILLPDAAFYTAAGIVRERSWNLCWNS